jgi:hypothetical protein
VGHCLLWKGFARAALLLLQQQKCLGLATQLLTCLMLLLVLLEPCLEATSAGQLLVQCYLPASWLLCCQLPQEACTRCLLLAHCLWPRCCCQVSLHLQASDYCCRHYQLLLLPSRARSL